MPLSDDFKQEIKTAANEALASEEANHAANGSKTTDGVGAETSASEDGASSDAVGDGDGAVIVEEGSSGSGNSAADPVDTGAETKPAEVPNTISDAILTEAVRHGIPLEDARQFPSEASLGRAIAAVRKSIEELAPKVEPKAEPEEDLFAKIPKLDPEQFEPEVVQMFGTMLDVVKKQQEQLKELRAQTQQYNTNATQAQQAAATREITEWFDGQVAKLGDEFKDVLGVGGTDALAPTSSHKAKRDAIANQTAVLLAGYNALGTAPASRDEVFKAAARIVLADEYAKLGQKKLTSQLEKRSKQHIQRGGGQMKGKSDATYEDEAAKALRDKFGIN